MFCEHCGDTNGEITGVDHDERDCPNYSIELDDPIAASDQAPTEG